MKIYNKQKTKDVVYFCKFKNGLLKIGTTSHLENRIRGLRHQCGFEEFNYFCVEGSFKTEAYYKNKFKRYNTYGEWFSLDFEKVRAIVEKDEIQINEKKENNNSTRNDAPIYDFIYWRHTMEIVDRYIEDIIVNPKILLDIKEQNLERLIFEMLDLAKELGEEEYEDALIDSEEINTKYEFYCYIERPYYSSSYEIDRTIEEFMDDKISYKELVIRTINLLERRIEEGKNKSTVYLEFPIMNVLKELKETLF